MDGTLITPSITSLYSHTEDDPLDLTQLAGRHAHHINLDAAKHAYRDAVEEAIRLIRPLWTVTLDGAVYGPCNWRSLTGNEAEELRDMIDTIDVDAIIAATTR